MLKLKKVLKSILVAGIIVGSLVGYSNVNAKGNCEYRDSITKKTVKVVKIGDNLKRTEENIKKSAPNKFQEFVGWDSKGRMYAEFYDIDSSLVVFFNDNLKVDSTHYEKIGNTSESAENGGVHVDMGVVPEVMNLIQKGMSRDAIENIIGMTNLKDNFDIHVVDYYNGDKHIIIHYDNNEKMLGGYYDEFKAGEE